MVLFTTSRRNNFVGGKCAPPSAVLVYYCVQPTACEVVVLVVFVTLFVSLFVISITRKWTGKTMLAFLRPSLELQAHNMLTCIS